MKKANKKPAAMFAVSFTRIVVIAIMVGAFGCAYEPECKHVDGVSVVAPSGVAYKPEIEISSGSSTSTTEPAMLVVANSNVSATYCSAHLSLLDPESGKLLDTIPAQWDEFGGTTYYSFTGAVALDPTGRYAYVPSRSENSLLIFDLRPDRGGRRMIDNIKTGGDPYELVYAAGARISSRYLQSKEPDEDTEFPPETRDLIIVGNLGSDNLTVIDAATKRRLDYRWGGGRGGRRPEIPLIPDAAPASLAYSEKNNELFVAGQGANDVYVINLENFDREFIGLTFGSFSASRGAAIAGGPRPGTEYAYFSYRSPSSVGVFDLQSRKLVDSLMLGIRPTGIAALPGGRTILAVDSGMRRLHVIGVDPLRVITTGILKKGASRVIIRPDGKVAYVSNFSGTISRIDLETMSSTNFE